MRHIVIDRFDEWRGSARALLAQEVPPEAVQWLDQSSGGGSLFAEVSDDEFPAVKAPARSSVVRVPRAFVDLAKSVACHRHPSRWRLLYSLLWRLTHNEPDLLEQEVDELVHAVRQMERSVRRDVHKMKAFVRFRHTIRTAEQGEEDWFVAWHRPDHRIVRLASPFFARRFATMRWAILTPDESATWDGERLEFGPGATSNEAPSADELEELWKNYYRATFNPARVSLKLMRREMPVRHWPTLPEAEIIDDLVREAPDRVEEMIRHREGSTISARDFLPDERNLTALAEAAQGCRGCELYKRGTQTVFGEGPRTATVMFVGEQPGDQEDLQGKPFVGPAGQLLDKAMEQAGIDRSQA